MLLRGVHSVVLNPYASSICSLLIMRYFSKVETNSRTCVFEGIVY
jgi:hypothetical protein